MQPFHFSVPQDVIVGSGAAEQLGEAAKKLGGTHALIISGPHLTKMGHVKHCADLLAAAGIASDAFTETEGNPSTDTVAKAADMYKSCGADFLVAFGGGSPMDVAKAVAVVAKFGGKITDYEGTNTVPGEPIPLIALPTTAGTGSEVTAAAVITDHARNYKLTVFDAKLIPKAAILDPDFLTTAPMGIAAACGIDAMVHAIEAYISRAASPFSDAMAEKALALIGKNLRRYVANRTNLEAASGMLTGSLFAGIAFSWARLGDVHAMSHPVSAYFNVPHGVANAILLPTVMAFNSLADTGKYQNIYNYVALNPASEYFEPQDLVELLKELNADLGIPACLADVGVQADKFDAMADDAMKSGNIAVNPRTTTKKDILALYQQAL